MNHPIHQPWLGGNSIADGLRHDHPIVPMTNIYHLLSQHDPVFSKNGSDWIIVSHAKSSVFLAKSQRFP